MTLLILILVSAGVAILLGWSFWKILLLIGVCAGFNWLRNRPSQQNSGAIALIAAAVAFAILVSIISERAKKELPLTASLGPEIKLGWDLRLSSSLLDPAVKAKVAALLAQTELEDNQAAEIRTLILNGKGEEALTRLQKLNEQGQKLRDLISGRNEQPKKGGEWTVYKSFSGKQEIFFPPGNYILKPACEIVRQSGFRMKVDEFGSSGERISLHPKDLSAVTIFRKQS